MARQQGTDSLPPNVTGDSPTLSTHARTRRNIILSTRLMSGVPRSVRVAAREKQPVGTTGKEHQRPPRTGQKRNGRSTRAQPAGSDRKHRGGGRGREGEARREGRGDQLGSEALGPNENVNVFSGDRMMQLNIYLLYAEQGRCATRPSRPTGDGCRRRRALNSAPTKENVSPKHRQPTLAGRKTCAKRTTGLKTENRRAE